MVNIELRKQLQDFLVNVINNNDLHVSIKEDQKGLGCIYVYNNKLVGNNSKSKALLYREFVYNKTSEATLLKNINQALKEVLLVLEHDYKKIVMYSLEKQALHMIYNIFETQEKEMTAGMLEMLIKLYKDCAKSPE